MYECQKGVFGDLLCIGGDIANWIYFCVCNPIFFIDIFKIYNKLN